MQKNDPINSTSSIPPKAKWLLVEKITSLKNKQVFWENRWRSLITQQHFVFRQILGCWDNDHKGAALYCTVWLDPRHVHLRATPVNLIEQTNTRPWHICSPERHFPSRMGTILTFLISWNTTKQIADKLAKPSLIQNKNSIRVIIKTLNEKKKKSASKYQHNEFGMKHFTATTAEAQ